MKNALRIVACLASLSFLTACDSPFHGPGSDPTPGESTPAEDAAAISNYIVSVTITVPGDGNNINVGNGSINTTDNHSTTTTNQQDSTL